MRARPERLSLRDLAQAADVSVSTLRHYFGDRDGAIVAALQALNAAGAPHMALAALPQHPDPRRALAHFMSQLREAWAAHGVGRVFAAGLAEGLDHSGLGPAVVQEILEPTLQCCERLLAALQDRGDLPAMDRRAATLSLLSPLLLSWLHQGNLGGVACRPLDLEQRSAAHLDRWWVGWVVAPGGA